MPDDTSNSLLMNAANAFERDWREGLFLLAAEKNNPAGSQTLRYWQNIANYLTELCHIPESEEAVSVTSPGEGGGATWLLTAPPMVGGEYLSLGQDVCEKWFCVPS